MADNKAKFWVGVLYTENMKEDWKDSISSYLEIPYAYCVHDKDTLSDSAEDRKEHVHVILAFNNTTTYNHAMSVFKELNATGKNAINTCKRIISIRRMYDYLIHDTDDCKKKGKHLYLPDERITGNNFDIGAYEQLDTNDKLSIVKDITHAISKHRIFNFFDLQVYIMSLDDSQYLQVFKENQGYFANLVRGYYNKIKLSMTGEADLLTKYLDSLEVKEG